MSDEQYRPVLFGGYWQITRKDNTSAGPMWDEYQATRFCAYLNQETAPLLARISELEAFVNGIAEQDEEAGGNTASEYYSNWVSWAKGLAKKAGGND